MNIIKWLRRPFCTFCKFRKAIAWYGSGTEEACNKCIPRGCSCNIEPVDGDWENTDPSNWEERVDERGRKYPCCEWMYY